MKSNLQEKLRKIKIVVSDFDGVMTDGYVYVMENGKESVRCSRKDGLGIGMLKKAGIKIFVLSKEKNPVVAARCRKLEIPCVQGIEGSDGKLVAFKKLLAKAKIDRSEALYIGDDINDLSALKYAGLAVTVSDGHELVKKVCHFETVARGGEHAIRELCELILAAQKKSLETLIC